MTGLALVIEDENWRGHRGLQTQLKRATAAACKTAKLRGDFTLLLTDNAKLKSLNKDFRRINKPTNVLSFPSDEPGYHGDIAIAYGVTQAEAKASGKTFIDHAVHLAVHGVLHLAGYDHERPKDAKVMEPLEVKILARLGIADPYAVTS